MANGDPQQIIPVARATKLLESFGINSPEEIHLEDISAALGIRVEVRPLVGADAHLLRVGDSGTITINERIAIDPCRARFAIAHELGHWMLHKDKSQIFLCTTEDLRDYKNSLTELEANAFAAELLMPRQMIPGSILKLDPGLEPVRQIAEIFNVSLTAAAIRWVVELSDHPVMMVISDGKEVHWWRRNEKRAGSLRFQSRQVLSPETCANARSRGESAESGAVEHLWEIWFPHIENEEAPAVYENTVPLGDSGLLLTILYVPDLVE